MMVAQSNGRAGTAGLPELPSAEPTRRGAQARVASVPDPPATVTESDARRAPPVALISAALTGGSLLHAQPPSLAQAWVRHRQSAQHYQGWILRLPRYAWGCLHVALMAALYALSWVFDSPVKLIAAAGLLAACWFWS